MRIVQLSANNFMRLKAVEINPDGSVVILRGKNAQGKSSILNAIFAALCGKKAVPAKPIRDGEKSADITVNMGEYVVIRTFTENDTYLTVKAADGSSIKKPQELLDRIVGAISFDPLEFIRLKSVEQARHLMEITGVSFDDLNAKRQVAYENRTATNRTIKTAEATVAALNNELRGHKADEFTAEISAQEAADAYTNANAEHSKVNDLVMAIGQCNHEIDTIEKEIDALNEKRNNRMARMSELVAMHKEKNDNLPDLEALKQRMTTVNDHNAIVRKFDERKRVEAELKALREKSDKMSAEIEAIDDLKHELAAKAKLPVGGLTFNDEGVSYNNIPLDQCSSSEQLRISIALAMAANPDLRVIRITDGSLLDSDSLEMVEMMADTEDFQIWIEKVDESADGVGFVIEDGEVK